MATLQWKFRISSHLNVFLSIFFSSQRVLVHFHLISTCCCPFSSHLNVFLSIFFSSQRVVVHFLLISTCCCPFSSHLNVFLSNFFSSQRVLVHFLLISTCCCPISSHLNVFLSIFFSFQRVLVHFLCISCHSQIHYIYIIYFNLLRPGDAYIRQRIASRLVQVMAGCLLGVKALPRPVLINGRLNAEEEDQPKFNIKFIYL